MRKQLRLLMKHFSRPDSGWRVCALLGDRGEPDFGRELEDARERGATIRMVPTFGRSIRPARDAAAYRFLKQALREWKPDVVHTHSSKGGFLGRLAARATHVTRIVHTPHVFPFQWTSGLRRTFYYQLERFAARRCDALVCVGQQQYELALRSQLAPPQRFHVIRNGVPSIERTSANQRIALRGELQLPPEAPIIGMVARLAPQKGVGAFLDCAAQVARSNPEVLFVLIGDGPEEAQVRARVQALHLGDRFRMLGHRNDAEHLYGAFDVLALSSLYEGLPYVLLEGMACGLPIVATDVLGTSELIADGVNGRLVSPGHAEQMSACLLDLLASAEMRQRMGDAARERVRTEFTLDAFLSGHERLYGAEQGHGPD